MESQEVNGYPRNSMEINGDPRKCVESENTMGLHRNKGNLWKSMERKQIPAAQRKTNRINETLKSMEINKEISGNLWNSIASEDIHGNHWKSTEIPKGAPTNKASWIRPFRWRPSQKQLSLLLGASRLCDIWAQGSIPQSLVLWYEGRL